MTGISTERRGEILVLTLDRPEALNAISVEVREELNRQMHDIELMAQECRAVVITGQGRAFCAGGDVSQMVEFFGAGPDVAVRHMLRFQEMVRLIWRLPVPVITAVNGLALGGGTAVALMSDLRLASEDAVFGVGQLSPGGARDGLDQPGGRRR
jgi:enoyl-CoA hydratase/carnithine racemase